MSRSRIPKSRKDWRPAQEDGGRPLLFLADGTPCPMEPRSSRSRSSVREVSFEELEDGSLVELVEDSTDPARVSLALWKDGKVCYLQRLEHRGQILVPPQRQDEVLRHMRLPREAKPYPGVTELSFWIFNLIRKCASLPDVYYCVAASFALCTWVVDRLLVAPYLLVTGLPQSGKTTLLRTLALVCRRPVLIGDATSAAFYDMCARFTPTLLIDEVDSHVGQSRQALFHLLKTGTTRDVLAVNRSGTSHCFGPKVLCTLQPFDDAALLSRGILIPMTEASKKGLIDPSHPQLQKYAAELQAYLLQFRCQNCQSIQPASIRGAERLRPREQDIFGCLAAPFAGDELWTKTLLEFFLDQNRMRCEPLLVPHEAVLASLFDCIHPAPGANVIKVGDLTALANKELRRKGERFSLEPRKVGAILTSLGFENRERANDGWRLWLDRPAKERIHELVRRYMVGREDGSLAWIARWTCELCQVAETGGKAQTPM